MQNPVEATQGKALAEVGWSGVHMGTHMYVHIDMHFHYFRIFFCHCLLKKFNLAAIFHYYCFQTSTILHFPQEIQYKF